MLQALKLPQVNFQWSKGLEPALIHVAIGISPLQRIEKNSRERKDYPTFGEIRLGATGAKLRLWSLLNGNDCCCA